MIKKIICCLTLLLSFSAYAKPAPWYLWQSQIDGHFICIQASAGDGWRKLAGPFDSAQCRRHLKQQLIDRELFSGQGKLFYPAKQRQSAK